MASSKQILSKFKQAKIHKDSSVDMALKNGKFVLTPLFRPVYTLRKLLSGVNKRNIHQEHDFGQPQGAELW